MLTSTPTENLLDNYTTRVVSCGYFLYQIPHDILSSEIIHLVATVTNKMTNLMLQYRLSLNVFYIPKKHCQL